MSSTAGGTRTKFAIWLRTGLRWGSGASGGLEFKFNPYHDPRNGRFTFAPSGSESASSRASPSPQRRLAADATHPLAPATVASSFLRGRQRPLDQRPGTTATSALDDGIFRWNAAELLRRTQYRPGPPRMGGNIRAFQDPMTLAETFPGLRESPGGSVLALADNIFDLTGPAHAVTTDLSVAYSRMLIGQIEALDPGYRRQSLGVPTTLAGQMNEISDLRLDRATAFYRKRGETAPLQVETLRFVQASTDRAYDTGVKLYDRGKLDVRLSREEAIGNFVDRQVRQDLRELYGRLGISTARDQQVRVNSREYETSGTDSAYRTPDARVGKVVYDWTLTRKTAGIAQIRGYFNSDLKPNSVVIVRPTQLGRGSTYAIIRPGS